MFSSIQQKSTDKKYTMSIAATLALLLSFASLTTSLGSAAFAQSNQTTTPNQTGAQVTGQPETTLLNKTTIPAQQTNVTVNQTTEPVSPQALQPLENLTQSQTGANLSGIENKTMVTPTGNATTTIVNKTTVPFNQTMVSAGETNQTTGQQQQGQSQQQQQTSNATSSSQPSASAGGGGGSNQTQQQEQANDTASSQQSGDGGGGGGRVEQENQQNNTQGGGNDPLSQMGESIGNIFGQ